MQSTDVDRFQDLVNLLGLKKPGTNPFNPDKLDASYHGASHGDKMTISFLLNLWDSCQHWKAGKFDVLEALRVWGATERTIFTEWAKKPFWP